MENAEHSPENIIESLKTLLIENPDNSDVLTQLGQVYFQLEKHDEAAAQFRKLSSIQPDNASVWLTLGYILSLNEKYRDAVEPLRNALKLDPSSPEACFHLAESLRKDQRFEESIAYYQKMLSVAAEYPQAILGLGKSLLAVGQLENAWDAMEFRKVCNFGTWEQHHLPSWDGNENQTVLAFSEESIAADLMFASCLPDFINNTERCVVECSPNLHQLFQRSFPKATFVSPTADAVDEQNSWDLPIDSQVAMGSLPRFFRPSVADFPLRKSYLIPDTDKVEQWSNRLSQIGGVPKIGFLWQGTWTAETERQTYLPPFEFRNLMLKSNGAAWINLQNGAKANELDALCRDVSLPIRRFDNVFSNLDELAALLVALDLVITPPGYIAQLAGAVGAKTWLILPERSDWRWNLGTEHCVWHPSMKMYRKGLKQAWSPLFRNVESDLTEFVKTHRPPVEISPVTLQFPRPQQREILRRVA
jgi:hypothetical protein